jgi:hypothetical protein
MKVQVALKVVDEVGDEVYKSNPLTEELASSFSMVAQDMHKSLAPHSPPKIVPFPSIVSMFSNLDS